MSEESLRESRERVVWAQQFVNTYPYAFHCFSREAEIAKVDTPLKRGLEDLHRDVRGDRRATAAARAVLKPYTMLRSANVIAEGMEHIAWHMGSDPHWALLERFARLGLPLERREEADKTPIYYGVGMFPRPQSNYMGRDITTLVPTLTSRFSTPKAQYMGLINRERQQLGLPLLSDEGAMIEWKQDQQRQNLSRWFRYLLRPGEFLETQYPDFFKFWILQEVIRSQMPSAKHRSQDTVANHLDFSAAIIAKIYDIVKKGVLSSRGANPIVPQTTYRMPPLRDLYVTAQRMLAEDTAKFRENLKPNSWLAFKEQEGYPLDGIMLTYASAGVPWCLAGLEVAKRYLSKGGIVYVYFDSLKNPQIGVHARNNEIVERRGADDSQELKGRDSGTNESFAKILDDFLRAPEVFVPGTEPFSNAAICAEQIEDNIRLTDLETLMLSGEFDNLAVEERRGYLKGLYEIDRPNRPFGQRYKDPRITMLREKRKSPIEDAKIIYGSIATNAAELDEDVNAYIGPVDKNIWRKWISLNDRRRAMYPTRPPIALYTHFPDTRVLTQQLTKVPRSADDFQSAIQPRGFLAEDDVYREIRRFTEADLKETGDAMVVLIPSEIVRKVIGQSVHMFVPEQLRARGLAIVPKMLLPELFSMLSGVETYARAVYAFTEAAPFTDKATVFGVEDPNTFRKRIIVRKPNDVMDGPVKSYAFILR